MTPKVRRDNEQRDAAYTTARWDLVELVPDTAVQVLDIGCSNGALGAALKRAKPGRRVIGVELDEQFAAGAGNLLDEVVIANVEAIDWACQFPDQFFDCIVFGDVLEHLIRPDSVLDQALRKLTQGGAIVVSLPNVRHASAMSSIFVRGRFPQADRGIFDRTHLRWFTIRDARSLVGGAGLRVEKEVFNLRWGDRGGGLPNRLLQRIPDVVAGWGPVREFLTYQYSFRSVRKREV